MSKYKTLFGSATLALAPVLTGGATIATMAVSAPAAAQDNSGCSNGEVRDDFGFCVAAADNSHVRVTYEQRQERTREDRSSERDDQESAYVISEHDYRMIESCLNTSEEALRPNRYIQQLDRRVRGQVSGTVLESFGSPGGRLVAQQQARVNACRPVISVLAQYEGDWSAVPEHQQESLRRGWHMATELGPKTMARRQIRDVSTRVQYDLADRASRALGF